MMHPSVSGLLVIFAFMTPVQSARVDTKKVTEVTLAQESLAEILDRAKSFDENELRSFDEKEGVLLKSMLLKALNGSADHLGAESLAQVNSDENLDQDDANGAPLCCKVNCCWKRPLRRNKCIKELNICHRTGPFKWMNPDTSA